MKEKNNNLLGILGAVLGAFIGAIPWILVYVYGNLMFSFLAFEFARVLTQPQPCDMLISFLFYTVEFGAPPFLR